MRIGILQCDDVRSSLSVEFGEYPSMIADQLAIADETFEFHTYRVHEGVLPDCIHDCDAYVITGSRHSIFDAEVLWINCLQNFIVRLNKAKIKTIGICFGHQLMAEALGGKVERADCGWLVGVHKVTMKQHKAFMQPSAERFYVAMMCEDQVQQISETAEILASSKNCEYAMLQYGDHMLSVQGHPEFSPEFAKRLLRIRQDDFPSKRYEKGSASFAEHELDSGLIFKWFARFLAEGYEPEQAEALEVSLQKAT